jgi:choline dehydrogenase-like flavoprotein
MAVVNQYRQLRAISNLRVVDASVRSAIPRTNINLTCIMIGEQGSEWLRTKCRIESFVEERLRRS